MEIEALACDYDLKVAGLSCESRIDECEFQFIGLANYGVDMPVRRSILQRIDSLARRVRDDVDRRWRNDTYLSRRALPPERRNWLAQLRGFQFDLIIVHHARNLPIAVNLSRDQRIPLIFNAHEYYPREFEGNDWWDSNVKPVAGHICERYLSQIDVCFTVSEGIALEYERCFGIDVEVLMSTKPYHDLRPTPVSPNRIRLIHHGIANPDREIEKMIELVDLLDPRFEIDFMLLPSTNHRDYFNELIRRIEDHPRLRSIPPVSTSAIVHRIHEYDLGLFFLRPNTFNLLHALPNKLFEFIQARLGVAFTPLPDVARVVQQFELGVLSADFSLGSLAAALNALTTERISDFKHASGRAAAVLCSESSRGQIQQTVARLIRDRRAVASVASSNRSLGVV
jgi:hypothetical protein